jgi:cobalt/nickel transport system permease protein
MGVNIVNMAIVPGVVAWAALRRWHRIEVAAFLSVMAASLAFSLEYALGGLGGAPADLVLRDMVGVHLLIALGETALATAVVLAVRRLEPSPGALVALSGAVAVLLAPWANPNPDGLQRVAIDRGFASLERAPDYLTPLAGYVTSGVEQAQLTVALAGLAGVVVVGTGAWLLARTLVPRRATTA